MKPVIIFGISLIVLGIILAIDLITTVLDTTLFGIIDSLYNFFEVHNPRYLHFFSLPVLLILVGTYLMFKQRLLKFIK